MQSHLSDFRQTLMNDISHLKTYSHPKIFYALLCLIWFNLSSCGSEENIPDVSHIKSEVKIQRFEQDLFAIDTANVEQGVAALRQKHGTFFDQAFLKIIADLRNPDASAEQLIGGMIKNTSIRKLNDTCQIVFPAVAEMEEELAQAFQFYQHYFPKGNVPEVYSYISEYSLGAFTLGDSLMGFGWDFFLGEDYPLYDPNYFPAYVRKYMKKDYLVPKLIEALATEKVGEQRGNRMLDYMIHNGKVLYIKDLLLPYKPDSVILEYSRAQTDWVNNNGFEMWKHFRKENLIYSTDFRKFQKLVGQSPIAAPGMPQEAPGRTANWMGWQIIKAYMKRHPNLSVSDLCAIRDPQVILDGSRYKPRQ